MDAPAPAPVSTATSAPSATNFFTVSGVAATRRSSAASSLRTPSFTRGPSVLDDQDDDEGGDQADDRAPFHQRCEPGIALLMRRHVVGLSSFGCHLDPLPDFRGGSFIKRHRCTQAQIQPVIIAGPVTVFFRPNFTHGA